MDLPSRRERWAVRAVVAVSLACVAIGAILLARHWPPPPSFGFPGFQAVVTVMVGGMGLLLVTRRPGNTIGWLLLAEGTMTSIQFAFDLAPNTAAELGYGPSVVGWLAWFTSGIFIPSLALFAPIFLLFPDGRPPTPRWRVVLVGTAVGAAVMWLGQAAAPGELQYYPGVRNPFPITVSWWVVPFGAGGLLLLASTLVSALSLLVRWRRSRGDAREQMKWLAAVALPVVVAGALSSFIPAMSYVMIAFGLAMPVAIATAILRHRLYDIDEIISRTVVYGALTAILAGIFAATLKFLQEAFVQVTGAQSDGAVILSTLVIAAAFTPVRKALEQVVDRRFKPAPAAVTAPVTMPSGAAMGAEDMEALVRRAVREELSAILAIRPDAAGGAPAGADPQA